MGFALQHTYLFAALTFDPLSFYAHLFGFKTTCILSLLFCCWFRCLLSLLRNRTASSPTSLYRAWGDIDLSSDTRLDRLLTEDGIAPVNGMKSSVGLPNLSPTEIDLSTRNTTVKFEESDDESSVNGTESEVVPFNHIIVCSLYSMCDFFE